MIKKTLPKPKKLRGVCKKNCSATLDQIKSLNFKPTLMKKENKNKYCESFFGVFLFHHYFQLFWVTAVCGKVSNNIKCEEWKKFKDCYSFPNSFQYIFFSHANTKINNKQTRPTFWLTIFFSHITLLKGTTMTMMKTKQCDKSFNIKHKLYKTKKNMNDFLFFLLKQITPKNLKYQLERKKKSIQIISFILF